MVAAKVEGRSKAASRAGKPAESKKKRASTAVKSEQAEPKLSISKASPRQSKLAAPRSKDHSARERAIKDTLYTLLDPTALPSTICPSQIPRKLHDTDASRYPDWRSMMDQVRGVVWGEVKSGYVEVTQKGEPRSYEKRGDIKGPIRVRKGPKWDEHG